MNITNRVKKVVFMSSFHVPFLLCNFGLTSVKNLVNYSNFMFASKKSRYALPENGNVYYART